MASAAPLAVPLSLSRVRSARVAEPAIRSKPLWSSAEDAAETNAMASAWGAVERKDSTTSRACLGGQRCATASTSARAASTVSWLCTSAAGTTAAATRLARARTSTRHGTLPLSAWSAAPARRTSAVASWAEADANAAAEVDAEAEVASCCPAAPSPVSPAARPAAPPRGSVRAPRGTYRRVCTQSARMSTSRGSSRELSSAAWSCFQGSVTTSFLQCRRSRCSAL
jgi:hypothetical protein